VFNLLSVEESLLLPVFQGQLGEDGEEEPNQRMIHLNGLKRMVELRGGLGAIKSNRCLQAFILWCVNDPDHCPAQNGWHC